MTQYTQQYTHLSQPPMAQQRPAAGNPQFPSQHVPSIPHQQAPSSYDNRQYARTPVQYQQPGVQSNPPPMPPYNHHQHQTSSVQPSRPVVAPRQTHMQPQLSSLQYSQPQPMQHPSRGNGNGFHYGQPQQPPPQQQYQPHYPPQSAPPIAAPLLPAVFPRKSALSSAEPKRPLPHPGMPPVASSSRSRPESMPPPARTHLPSSFQSQVSPSVSRISTVFNRVSDPRTSQPSSPLVPTQPTSKRPLPSPQAPQHGSSTNRQSVDLTNPKSSNAVKRALPTSPPMASGSGSSVSSITAKFEGLGTVANNTSILSHIPASSLGVQRPRSSTVPDGGADPNSAGGSQFTAAIGTSASTVQPSVSAGALKSSPQGRGFSIPPPPTIGSILGLPPPNLQESRQAGSSSSSRDAVTATETKDQASLNRFSSIRRALPRSPAMPPDLTQALKQGYASPLSRHETHPSINIPSRPPSSIGPLPLRSAPNLPKHDVNPDDSFESNSSSSHSSQSLDYVDAISENFDPPSPQYGIRDLPKRQQTLHERTSSETVAHWTKSTTSHSVYNTRSPHAQSQPSLVRSSSRALPTPRHTNNMPGPSSATSRVRSTEQTAYVHSPKPRPLSGHGNILNSYAEKSSTSRPDGGKQQSRAFQLASMAYDIDQNVQGQNKPSAPRSFTPRSRAGGTNLDLNLDDAPPLSLRRTPSPSSSTPSSVSSASVPSIPSIKTPDDSSPSHSGRPQIPNIILPGEASSISPPTINVPIPSIRFGDDDDDEEPITPVSAVTTRAPHISTSSFSSGMPSIITNDFSEPPQSKGNRSLPQPPAAAPSAQAPATRPRGGGLVCGGCLHPISGRIVSAMGLRWHPDCFKCTICAEKLEHVSAYEAGGKPYCHLDYHEQFAPRCYHCRTPIVDERFITLDDPGLGKRTYHEQHFFCAECGDPFLAPSSNARKDTNRQNISISGDGEFDFDDDDVGFTVYRGHPYCEACHVRLRMPKCKKCKKSIRDGMQAVEALGGKWCWECFVCASCEKPFKEPSFFQRDKKPYCEPCFSLILRNEI